MKKIVSVMITILIICSMCTLNAKAYTYIWYDGMIDGVVADYTVYGYEKSKDLIIGDVNQDGDIDIEDVTLIQKYLAGLTVSFALEDELEFYAYSTFPRVADVEYNPTHFRPIYDVSIKDATLIQMYLAKKDVTSDNKCYIGYVVYDHNHEHDWIPSYRVESNDEVVEIPGTSIKYYDVWDECSCGIQWHYKKAKCYCEGDSHIFDNKCLAVANKIFDELYYSHYEREWYKMLDKWDELEAAGTPEEDIYAWLETLDSHARTGWSKYDHTGPDTEVIRHEEGYSVVVDHYTCKECGETK